MNRGIWMTIEQKETAIAVLDANIPSEQTTINGKYVQVLSYSPDGTHTIRLDEYVSSKGVGYCRYITRPETGDADLINVFADPFGPSPWVSGWSSYRISEIP